ncbi:MAG: SBBP repeat-containing protein, partial [Candidatus Bipolaricaulaceae bacterium]
MAQDEGAKRAWAKGWLLVVLWVVALSLEVFGQEILWIRQFGIVGTTGYSVAVDGSGNVYVVGN